MSEEGPKKGFKLPILRGAKQSSLLQSGQGQEPKPSILSGGVQKSAESTALQAIQREQLAKFISSQRNDQREQAASLSREHAIRSVVSEDQLFAALQKGNLESLPAPLIQVISGISRDFKLRIASVLDFSASTERDVKKFADEIDQLLNALQPEFIGGIHFLPIAARGVDKMSNQAEVVIGSEGERDFYSKVENRSFVGKSGVGPTPVGAGIVEVADQRFYYSPKPPNTVQALTCIADADFEIPAEFERALTRLNDGNVATISLTSRGAETHKKALLQLGELGTVVDRTKPGIDPIQLIVQFILHQKNLQLAPAVMRSLGVQETSLIRPKSLSRSFANRLILKGFAREAENLLEGREVKSLTGGKVE